MCARGAPPAGARVHARDGGRALAVGVFKHCGDFFGLREAPEWILRVWKGIYYLGVVA